MTDQGDGLDAWVRSRYERAYRTAVMICGNRADAEEAVQDAFLRVWRFRDAIPDDSKRNAWLYRVLVNVRDYGSGDLRGLALLGRQTCFPDI